MSTKSRGLRDLLNLIENAPDRFLPVITQLAQDASELGEGARDFLRNRFGEDAVNNLLNAPNPSVRQTFRGGVTVPKSSQSQFPSRNPAPRPRFGPNAEVATPAAVRQSRFPTGPSAPVPEFSSVATRRSRLGDAIDRGEINLTQKRAAPEETQILQTPQTPQTSQIPQVSRVPLTPQNLGSDLFADPYGAVIGPVSETPAKRLRDFYSLRQRGLEAAAEQPGVPVQPTNPIISAVQGTLGLRMPKGARDTTGKAVGGRFYNYEAGSAPENKEVLSRMGFTSIGDAPDPTSVRVNPGQLELNNLYDLGYAPRVRLGQQPTYRLPNTLDALPRISADNVRPQGVQLTDFSKLTKQLESMSPRDKAKFLATTGLTGVGAVLLATRGENVSENASEPEMSEPPVPAAANGNGGLAGSTPGGFGSPEIDSIVTSSFTPPAKTTMSEQESGALNQNQEEILTALQQSDPASSAAIRAVAPKSPENYANIGDYYRDRAIFVKSLKDGTFQRIVDAIQADAGGNAKIGEWAGLHPNLAYDYAVRNQLVPELTQQTGESVATMGVGSALGDNNDASAVGMANAEADNVGAVMGAGAGVGVGVGGDLERAAAIQKNNEIISATQPIARPNLQRSQDLVQQYLMRRRGF